MRVDILNSPSLPGVEHLWLLGEQRHVKFLDHRTRGNTDPEKPARTFETVTRELGIGALE